MQKFKRRCKRINKHYSADFISPMTITLGDEFQSVIRSLHAAVDVIFAFEEEAIKNRRDFVLRYALNFGEIATPINPEAAYGMLGPGLIQARNLLSHMKQSKSRFQFHLENPNLTEKMSLIFRLYQSIVEDWRSRDLPLVNEFLCRMDYKAVAESLAKDPSLMWKRRKSLKIADYFAVKELALKEAQDS